MNINTYLKQKLAENNIQVDTLISACGSSKSTIYRVMNGLQMPSPKLRDCIIRILDLSELEQKELAYYFSTANLDDNIIDARGAVFDFLFSNKVNFPNKIELVYYDEEKYIRSFDTILENLLSTSHKDGFSCQMKLINCISDDVVLPLSAIIKQLSHRKCQYEIEHLVSFSSHDHKENVKTLAHIIPLLALENYILKYHEQENVANHGFFHNFLMLTYRYHESNGQPVVVNLCFSFLPNPLSTCYVIHDNNDNINLFFERNYLSLNRNCHSALSTRNNFAEYITDVRDMFSQHEVFILQPDLPLSRIPFSVFESIATRTSLKDFIALFLPNEFDSLSMRKYAVHPPNSSDERYLNTVLSYAQSIIDSTYVNRQIDVYSKSGLETFATTGVLQDHLELLPTFNKNEIKTTLQSLKSRDADVADPLNFFITKDDYTKNGLGIATVYDGYVLIENFANNNTSYCIIEHKKLSSIFADFANHYIPAMMAIPQEEAYAFINYLIETYC